MDGIDEDVREGPREEDRRREGLSCGGIVDKWDETMIEEALRARVRRKPEEPTVKEIEDHMMHHVNY